MKLLAAIFLLLGCASAHAQTNSLRFRITHIREISGCRQGQQGLVFEHGHISAEDRRHPVIVMIYLEKTNGSFVMLRRSYPPGTTNVKLDIFGCDYTGNHYAYIKYADDHSYQFPPADEVYRRHKEVLDTQKPEFIVTTIKSNPQCPHSYRIESGLVYSPAGGRVDIKLFVETTSGIWETIHLYRYGTGAVNIGYAACDLTGNTKAVASFGYSVNLSEISKK